MIAFSGGTESRISQHVWISFVYFPLAELKYRIGKILERGNSPNYNPGGVTIENISEYNKANFFCTESEVGWKKIDQPDCLSREINALN